MSHVDPGTTSKARELFCSLKPKQRPRHGTGARNITGRAGRWSNFTWDYGHHPRGKSVRPATRQAVEKMLEILRDGEHITIHHLKELQSLLEKCAAGEPLCSVLDRRGYDLVQRTVIQNSHLFLDCLIKKGLDVGKVRRACSSPLHLACKFGHSDVVRLLLNHGADVTFRSTACYPSYHYIIRDGPGCVQCTTTCHSKFTPLQIALIYDRDEVVRILLQHEGSARKVDTSNILLEACQRGAENCLAYLFNHFPGQVSHRDSSGETLLSVAFNKSEKCGRLILESGLQWDEDAMLNCSSRQASLLHVVYRSHTIDKPFEITKLAFKAGFKKKLCECKGQGR